MEVTMSDVRGAWGMRQHGQALVEVVLDTLVDDNNRCKRHNTVGEVDNKALPLTPAMEVAKQDGDSCPLFELYRMVWRYYPSEDS